MPKRQLRQPEGGERTEPLEQTADGAETVESADSAESAKRARTAGRWVIPPRPALLPLPPAHSEVSDDALQDFLGFGAFSSTKGLHVFANQDGPVPPRRKKRQYRQMLHIKGIYDIPLTRDQLEQRQ